MSDYLELMVGAEEALRDLLRSTEPGTGLYLHTTLAQLRTQIEDERREVDGEHSAAPPAASAKIPDWKDTYPLKEREREVLALLATEALTRREVMEQLREAHPELGVWQSNTDSIVTRLYRQRELDRTPEPAKNGRPRFRYFKRTTLDGPIADLDRAFGEGH